MGCFFACFRGKSSASNIITPPEDVTSRSKNALSSLFLCDEDDSVQKGEKGQNPLPPRGLDVRELKDEAKFLKACGILPETPVEIRKILGKWEDKLAKDEEKSSKFISRLPNASMEKLKLEKQSNESPLPVKSSEEWVTGSGSLMDSPSSCITDGHNTGAVSSSSIRRNDVQNAFTPVHMPDSESYSETSSLSTPIFAPSLQCKNKPVHFHCDSDKSGFVSKGSSPECARQHSKLSPYPTPLKLTDEMQTPGTVFPAHTNDGAGGEITKTKSRGKLEKENSDSIHLGESLKLNDEDNLMSTPMSDVPVKRLSVGKESKNEASLSSWLKPISAKQDGNNEQFGSFSGKKVYRGKAPGDRPILGMVAAHWNDDEAPHISPKWWDGNGIPNSTNKYKEDQKVSWHATPFEERLEKALSEETFISQRKTVSGRPPFEFNETEESDTALSHLQSPAHIKPVVSF